MQIRIRTLTPIWSGDVNRQCTRLRETSIIGSLRWWFEALVRGFGGYACDPTSSEKCEYRYNTNDICAVCELFGTTGWAKRFKFEIKQSFRQIYEDSLVIGGSSRNWYYPSGLISCNSVLNMLEQILPFELKDKDSENPNQENDLVKHIFNVLFTFISNWGMIGGKTAIGYGAVRFEDESGNSLKASNEDIKRFFKYLEKKEKLGKDAKNAPRIDEMFFARFKINEECIDKIIEKIKENILRTPNSIYKCNRTEEIISDGKKFLERLMDYYGFIPTSALVRKELRKRFREDYINNNPNTCSSWIQQLSTDALKELRHFIMGELGRFSAINVSHIYGNGKSWEFRVYGWIPKDIRQRLNINNIKIKRSDIIDYLKQIFNDQQFWQACLGSFCFLQKAEDKQVIVEYPNDGWNFIDFGKLNREETKEAFSKILRGGENENR